MKALILSDRKPGWLVRWGAALAGTGLALIVVSLVAFSFLSRLDSRVEANGLVGRGVASGQLDDPTADLDQASGYGIYEVRYSIAGADHVGYILGEFTSGQHIDIKAPENGSPYERLILADSAASKILSWTTMLIGLPLFAIGSMWLVTGLVRRNQEIKARVRAQYGLGRVAQSASGAIAPEAPAQPVRHETVAIPPPPPTPESGNEPPKGYFTAPYDI